MGSVQILCYLCDGNELQNHRYLTNSHGSKGIGFPHDIIVMFDKTLNQIMKMTEEAKRCDDCLCWLQHCSAECCSQFHFPINPKSDIAVEDNIVRIRIPITSDRRWYFELHGIEVQDDVLLIPKEHCSFTSELISVYMRCNHLTVENLCYGHPENKPDICKNVTLDNAREGKCDLTPNCLFLYKQRVK